jgi:hypothetical protein
MKKVSQGWMSPLLLASVAVLTTTALPLQAQESKPGVFSGLANAEAGPGSHGTAYAVGLDLDESRAGPGELDFRSHAARNRPLWYRPLIGAGIGAVVGAAYGTIVMVRADEWLAPPAHYITIPVGAMLGAGVGLLMN